MMYLTDTLPLQGYSIWFSEYKDNAEYTKKLMASNLIGGFFQRLDNAGGRKVSFANVHVFGQEPNLELGGCWLVKGQEIPEEFKEVPDFEGWEWTKVGLSSCADATDIATASCPQAPRHPSLKPHLLDGDVGFLDSLGGRRTEPQECCRRRT